MTDHSGSESTLEPDSDKLWLTDEGAEIKASRVYGAEKKRALDIVAAVRARYVKEKRI